MKSHFHVNRTKKEMILLETSMYKHEGCVLWGPPTKVVCHLPTKKYKRADLAGGERFWAGTSTVLQDDIMGWPLCSFPCAFWV